MDSICCSAEHHRGSVLAPIATADDTPAVTTAETGSGIFIAPSLTPTSSQMKKEPNLLEMEIMPEKIPVRIFPEENQTDENTSGESSQQTDENSEQPSENSSEDTSENTEESNDSSEAGTSSGGSSQNALN